ncbi:MAG TPA: PAS domain S-box protein [Desulfomonilaceae bacterium]|nr:PAS domain S-box protein [Desulfomonilaceae bacterium]
MQRNLETAEQLRKELEKMRKRLIQLESAESDPGRSKDVREATHRKLAKALKSNPDSVLITRLDDGIVIDANDSFLRTMGYSREEVVGKASSELRYWPNAEDREWFMRALKASEEYFGLETAVRARDGRIFPALVSGRIIEVDGEQWVVSITRDLSGLKEADRALRDSQKRYLELVDQANDVIYMTDANGFFTLVNPAGLKTTGYSVEEMIGKHYLELIHPEYKDRVEKFYGTQFVKRIPDTYLEVPIVTKTGDTVWLGQNVQLVIENDAVVGFRSICRDITQRKRAELRLSKSERRFRILTENAPFGLSVMGGDGRFHYFNPKFMEIFGYTLEDLPDKRTWFEKAYPDEAYRQEVMAIWQADSVGDGTPGEAPPRVFTVRCKDGTDKIIQFRAVVMEHGAQILTYQDITLQAKNEQALRESEIKYRTLFESANDAILVMDGEHFIDCNTRAWEMFRCAKEQIMGETIHRFCAERQRDGSVSREQAQEFLKAAAAGKKQIFEWQCRRYDGSVFDAEISLGRMELSGQTLVLVMVRNITERVLAQEALKEQQQMLHNILAASPVGIARLEERKISWVNEAMIKMFGYDSAEELIHKRARQLYGTDEEYQRIGEILYEGYKSGTEAESYTKFVRKDGSVFDGHVRISAPDPTDLKKGTIAAYSDISRLRKIETALKESERRYRRLVEQVPDIIFSLDPAGRFTFVNVQVERFLGYSTEHMLNTYLWEYTVPENRALAETVLLIGAEGIWDEEFGVLDSEGNRKWVRIRCQASCDERGLPVGYEGVMVDRTARKALEEELRVSREALVAKMRIIDDLYAHLIQSGKSKAIAEHTAEVAHELRQPLAIIGGFARRMAKQLEESDIMDANRQRECFHIMIAEVQRLEKILGALIDFARRDVIQVEMIDPNLLIREVLRVHQERFREKNLRVETQFGDQVGNVWVNSNRFEHVIRNLLSNAIEASPEGGMISIRTDVFVPSDKALRTGELAWKRYFEMKIRNEGRTIPAEEIQRFFDPFYTTKDYGIGIGLTLCKKIVEEHNGSISAKSDAEGTVLTVWLPLKSAGPVSQRPSN